MFAPRYFAPRYFAPRYFPIGRKAVRGRKEPRRRRIIWREIKDTTVPVETFVERRIKPAPKEVERPITPPAMLQPVEMPPVYIAEVIPFRLTVTQDDLLLRMEEDEEDAIVALLLAA